MVNNGAAGIDYVWHIAISFFFVGHEQWFFEPAQFNHWIFEVKQAGTQAIFAHGSNAVCDDEPAFVGFDGGTTVANLYEFPWLLWLLKQDGFFPEVEVAGEHDIVVDVVDAGEHDVLAVDFSGKECQVFIDGCFAVEW